jgi:hypothetical protein
MSRIVIVIYIHIYMVYIVLIYHSKNLYILVYKYIAVVILTWVVQKLS